MPEHLASRLLGLSIKRACVGRADVSLIVLLCVVLAGCGYPSVNDLASELDKLHVPGGWHLTDTVTNGPSGDIECVPQINGPACPMATRYYVVSASPQEAYEEGIEMIVDAGFTVEAAPVAPCERPPDASLCSSKAFADGRRVWVQVWKPGSAFPGVDVSDYDAPVVSVSLWTQMRN